MYRAQGVLGLLALCAGLVRSFSWDTVLTRSNRLEFYNEGTLVHMATPASHHIKWISYDPVHDRVLFAEKYNSEDSASSFDIANQTTQSLIKSKTDRYLKRFAYDPATELLFGTVTKSIYSFPLASGNNEVNGDLVITLETIPREVAVDSCGGYVYWTTNNIIERALFNGSEREVVIENNATLRQGLTIDTQKIYWIESQEFNDGGFSIESADLDGNNRRTVYSDTESDSTPDKLTVSKDFISWGDSIETFFWKLPKHPLKDTKVKPNKIAMNTTIFACVSHDIASNYKIEERTRRVPKCNALLSLLPDYHICLKASAFCVHGTKVIGEYRCDCIYGYIGERCDVSVCENYCLQGDCSISAEGQPKCRCNAGYSGTRCEVSVCHKHCLNNGTCSLNEEDNVVCECTGQYEGERCDTLKAGPTSDVDDRAPTPMNQTIETTKTSNTDVDNKIKSTMMPDTPTTLQEHTKKISTSDDKIRTMKTTTTPQENTESTTTRKKSSVVETSPTFDVDDRAPTPMNQTIETTKTSNTDVDNKIKSTMMPDTPTTLQEHTKKISTSDDKMRTMKTTIAPNIGDDDKTKTANTATATTPQENTEPTTTRKISSVVETNLTTPHEGFHWLPVVGGKLPPNAIIGGFEHGNEYIARANYKGSLCPGKYVESSGIAYFPWGGKEHIIEKFEVLCGFNATWVKTNDGNIPKNAIVGGTSEHESEPLYICRDKIEDRLICGKVHNIKCYLPYKSEEKEVSSYEILVVE